MNDVIYEAIVTTVRPDGTPHITPLGIRWRAGQVVLMPFRPSSTLAQALATRRAVVSLITDTRIMAGCVTGRRDWPCVPTAGGFRLAAALRHLDLQLARVDDDAQRPTLTFDVTADQTHAPFAGLNRAQAAVLEGAVLISRLHLLAPDKVDAEMAYLAIAIAKTASDAEREGWAWLQEAVAAHRQRQGA